jgi:hypothetical protein
LLFVSALVLAFAGGPGCGPCSSSTRSISGQVVDETGQPVPDAEVKLTWSIARGFDPTKGPSDNYATTLTTDAKGQFSGQGGNPYCGLSAEKAGYYRSMLSISGTMPGNSLRILLNKIRRPQPMVGKQANISLAEGFSRLEYDLLAGDCLPPHGTGSVADLVIEWRRPDSAKWEHPRDVITVRFPGSGNGAITQRIKYGGVFSALQSLHQAPETGYAANFAEADENAGGFEGEYHGAQKIRYFKIRSGMPPGPLFGKMLEDLRYIPRPLSNEDQFRFEYVINSSGDRGLEIDMKQIKVPSQHKLEYAPKQF